MLWVHVPYSRHKNELIEVEQEIMAENGYDSSIILIVMMEKKVII